MGNSRDCRFCDGADPERAKDGLIRCTRKHKFVDPFGSCPDFDFENNADMDAIRETLREENLRKLMYAHGGK